MTSGPRHRQGHPLAGLLSAVAALAAVLALDAVLASREWPLPVLGSMDELAHLATAWLFLSVLFSDGSRALLPWVLVGAVVIDVDHVPLYLWGIGSANGSGRPVTHSLTLVVLLLGLSTTSRRLRVPLRGLALGVLLHLVRDTATGPGAPLLWPASGISVLAPYAVYAAVLGLVTAVAVIVGVRRSAATPSLPPG